MHVVAPLSGVSFSFYISSGHHVEVLERSSTYMLSYICKK